VLCGFGRVRLVDLGFVYVVGFGITSAGSVLALPLRYKRCVYIFFKMEEQYLLNVYLYH